MAGSEVSERKKRNGHGAQEQANGSDAETTSQGSRRSSKDKKKRRRDEAVAAVSGDEEGDVGELKKISKKKRKHSSGPNGSGRRPSLSLPARDPRDSGAVVKAAPKAVNDDDGKETRSPSPMVDFDGLSRPSMLFTPRRLGISAGERASARVLERPSFG